MLVEFGLVDEGGGRLLEHELLELVIGAQNELGVQAVLDQLAADDLDGFVVPGLELVLN